MIKTLDVEEKGDIAVASFRDIITNRNVAVFREESLSDQIIANTDKKKIVLNMGSVRFLDSIFMGRIVGLYKTLAQIDGVLVLSNLTPEVSKILRIINLDKIIEIFDTEEEAVTKLS